jgi:hypothetical protein
VANEDVLLIDRAKLGGSLDAVREEVEKVSSASPQMEA